MYSLCPIFQIKLQWASRWNNHMEETPSIFIPTRDGKASSSRVSNIVRSNGDHLTYLNNNLHVDHCIDWSCWRSGCHVLNKWVTTCYEAAVLHCSYALEIKEKYLKPYPNWQRNGHLQNDIGHLSICLINFKSVIDSGDRLAKYHLYLYLRKNLMGFPTWVFVGIMCAFAHPIMHPTPSFVLGACVLKGHASAQGVTPSSQMPRDTRFHCLLFAFQRSGSPSQFQPK